MKQSLLNRENVQAVVFVVVLVVVFPVLSNKSDDARNAAVAVRDANLHVCETVTQPNVRVTNAKAAANAAGWREAWHSRLKLARVSVGTERTINLDAARRYHAIVLTLGAPLKNPPCAVRFPRP